MSGGEVGRRMPGRRALAWFRRESEAAARELLCPKCGLPIVEGYPGSQQSLRFNRGTEPAGAINRTDVPDVL